MEHDQNLSTYPQAIIPRILAINYLPHLVLMLWFGLTRPLGITPPNRATAASMIATITILQNRVCPHIFTKEFIFGKHTKVLAVKKGVSTHIHQIPPICPLCSSSVESMAHLFLQCPTTKPVWANTTFLPQAWAEDSHFKDWNMEHTVTAPNKDQFYHFVAILWAIWKRRNETIFSSSPFLALEPVALAVDTALCSIARLS